ncbi:unnamed protein product [Adineta steineri]|uniref:Peptidase M1 membrane alanine aminopeptidase domain-containing protein n=1 Tax=Adineta steineri TaxID=433720 RepID=A0A816FEI1_9BILA|nr:unnamed protein product [Adineta steineri]CAF1660502.1 unnamed protein product [Adineta steineri]
MRVYTQVGKKQHADQIAIPDFASRAMENWGLITYREIALLIDPTFSSMSARQRLNEGFARWIQYLAVDRFYLERDVLSQFLVLDALKSSHPIEIPIGHPSQIGEIFDIISYAKGSSVIRIMGKSGDQAIIDEAKNRFQQYINGNLIDPNIRPAVYVVVSHYGDENSASSRVGRDIVWKFLQKNWTKLVERFGENSVFLMQFC